MTGFAGADDLYREVILDHHRKPRRRALPAAAVVAEGVNPLCGDEVQVGIVVSDDGRIADYGFTGAGCAISQASASLLGDAVTGHSSNETRAIIAAFEALVRGSSATDDVDIGDLAALEGVAQFPMRVKCATLAARTLEQALSAAEAQR